MSLIVVCVILCCTVKYDVLESRIFGCETPSVYMITLLSKLCRIPFICASSRCWTHTTKWDWRTWSSWVELEPRCSRRRVCFVGWCPRNCAEQCITGAYMFVVVAVLCWGISYITSCEAILCCARLRTVMLICAEVWLNMLCCAVLCYNISANVQLLLVCCFAYYILCAVHYICVIVVSRLTSETAYALCNVSHRICSMVYDVGFMMYAAAYHMTCTTICVLCCDMLCHDALGP